MAPVRRDSARVLPVSPDGEVLLLQELDPAEPDRPYWSSIGGGIDPGESPAVAACRELLEETGIVAGGDDLVGPVHVEHATFSWNGEERAGEHTHYAMAMARSVAVSTAGLQPEEVDTVLAARWWRPDDLADVVCRPPYLIDIARAALAALEQSPEESP